MKEAKGNKKEPEFEMPISAWEVTADIKAIVAPVATATATTKLKKPSNLNKTT